ncbi:MAG: glycosyltransferase [Flavobacteriales bacterium]|nr:glycosyltransferase [Flavobacteriales bacterium]
MHVLFLPKWYPGRKDPQLGDFLRKQAMATAAFVRMSVVHVESYAAGEHVAREQLSETDGLWELVLRYPANTSQWTAYRKAVNAVRYWMAATRGWHRVVQERGRPDLIHAYILVRPVLFARWIRFRHRTPYLISEQSSEYLDGTFAAKSALFKFINRRSFRKASAITAVSNWLGDQLVRLDLCARYDVVPNVVPGLDRPLPPPGTPGDLLMVADLVDKTKNVSGVLRALHAARTAEPRLRLTIIGDGTDRRMLVELAKELELGDRVRFLGRMPNAEVLDHMGRTFAVIVNSNVETFSVVTGEALAQGKPVIATRCGGPIAFIKPVNGMLIGPGDDTALADAMIDLTRNAGRYDPAAIRNSVASDFSPAAVGSAFHAIYERILTHGN